MSIVTINPGKLCIFVYSNRSEVSLTDSPIYRSGTYAVWSLETKFEITFFKRVARTFEITLTSTLSNETGLQFLMYHLSLPFFSTSVTTACLWDVENSPSKNTLLRHSKSLGPSKSKKAR